MAAACGDDNNATAPSRGPDGAAPPFAEGTYELRVSSLGAAQGCEVVTPGVWRGPGELPAGGGFDSQLTVTAEGDGWVGRGTRNGQSGVIELRVAAGDWPRSARVTGTLQGQADQRAFDGPRVQFTGAGANSPATFDGIVITGSATPDLATGEARGRFVYESAWFGSVVSCTSATVTVKP